jgi:hypothetical protein
MSFDPSEFLDTPADFVERKLLPADIYEGVITEVKMASGVSTKNDQPWVRLDLVLELSGSAVEEALGRPTTKLTYGLMEDLDDVTGKPVITKKGRIDKARAALGLPEAGFNRRKFEGQFVRVQIEHRMLPDGSIREDVKAIIPSK